MSQRKGATFDGLIDNCELISESEMKGNFDEKILFGKIAHLLDLEIWITLIRICLEKRIDDCAEDGGKGFYTKMQCAIIMSP